VVIAAALCTAGALAAWHGLGARQAAPAVSYTLLCGNKSSTEAQRAKVLQVNFFVWRASSAKSS
jgi:hypothetical protein